MSKNKTHHNSSSFKNYFSGKQNSAQKEAFEKEVSNDDFEKEAFEGFTSLEDNAEVANLIDEINREVRTKTGLSNTYKSISFPFMKVLSAAASILVLLGFGFLINNQLKTNENTIAKNEVVTDSVNNDVLEEHIDFTEETIETEIAQDVSTSSIEVNESDDLVEDKEFFSPKKEAQDAQGHVNGNIVEQDAIVLDDETAAEPVAEPTPVIASDKKAIKQEEDMPQLIDNENEVATASSRAEVQSEFDIATKLFKEKQYKAAKNYYTIAINNNQHKEDATYYLAMCNYHLQNSNKAISTFDKIIAQKGLYANNAKWFKALLLLEQKRNSEAKVLLKNLAEGDSGFKNQAADLLDQID